MKKLGVEIIDYIPENAYLVYGDWNVLSAMQKRMADKNYVRWEGTYRPQDKIQPNALAADGSNGPANRPEPELFSIQMVLNPKANAETLKKIEQLQLASPLKQGASGNYYNIVPSYPLPKSLVWRSNRTLFPLAPTRLLGSGLSANVSS